MGGKLKVTKEEISKVFIESGKGIPRGILERVDRARKSAAKNKDEFDESEKKTTNKFDNLLSQPYKQFAATETTRSTTGPVMSEFSLKINLDEFDFPDEDTINPDVDIELDVTALDRYNEDIRKYRHTLLEECRLLPTTGEVSRSLLERIRQASFSLCRTCYYGTHKAQLLAEGSAIIFVWLLNRRNLTIQFHMKILQCVSEMVWSSKTLKLAFLRAHGVKVLIRQMRSGMFHHSDLACWAAYALIAISVGCPEVIAVAQRYPEMVEFVGEMSFPYYWREWPTNFGMILQGILFGPQAVTPLDEEFSFY